MATKGSGAQHADTKKLSIEEGRPPQRLANDVKQAL